MIGCHVRLLTRCSTGFSTIVPLESGKFSRDARILSNQCDMANHNDKTIPKCGNTRSYYQFNPWRRSGKRERGRAHSPTHAQAKRSQFPSQTAHSLHNTTPPRQLIALMIAGSVRTLGMEDALSYPHFERRAPAAPVRTDLPRSVSTRASN